jgi:hypothetical protein
MEDSLFKVLPPKDINNLDELVRVECVICQEEVSANYLTGHASRVHGLGQFTVNTSMRNWPEKK